MENEESREAVKEKKLEEVRRHLGTLLQTVQNAEGERNVLPSRVQKERAKLGRTDGRLDVMGVKV